MSTTVCSVGGCQCFPSHIYPDGSFAFCQGHFESGGINLVPVCQTCGIKPAKRGSMCDECYETMGEEKIGEEVESSGEQPQTEHTCNKCNVCDCKESVEYYLQGSNPSFGLCIEHFNSEVRSGTWVPTQACQACQSLGVGCGVCKIEPSSDSCEVPVSETGEPLMCDDVAAIEAGLSSQKTIADEIKKKYASLKAARERMDLAQGAVYEAEGDLDHAMHSWDNQTLEFRALVSPHLGEYPLRPGVVLVVENKMFSGRPSCVWRESKVL